MRPVRIDHVIYATADLDAAAGRVESDLGLNVIPGGRHEGHGTQNRIVPLGDGYLELMAIADADEARSSPIGSAVQARLAERGDGLFAWAIEVDDVEPVADRLGLEISTIARSGFSARLVGVAEALGEPGLPFFLSRDHEVPDPGVGGDVGGITWLEVACDTEQLELRLAGAKLPVSVVEGPPGVRAMGIGEREFRNT